jgi:hypothetical protein
MPRPRQESQERRGSGRQGLYIVLTHCPRQGRLGPLVAVKAARLSLPSTMAASPPGPASGSGSPISPNGRPGFPSRSAIRRRRYPQVLTLSPEWLTRPCLILRGAMIRTTQRPQNRAPAADSRAHPIQPAAAQSSHLAVLGRSLCDALSSRRFSGWQLNKNGQLHLFFPPATKGACWKRRMCLPGVSSMPTRHQSLTRLAKYLPSPFPQLRGCQRRHS